MKTLILTFLFLLLITMNTTMATDWYSADYGKRKYFEVNMSGETVTDWVFEMSINTSELYDDGNLQDDCDDLIFTDSSGTLLDFGNITDCDTSGGNTTFAIEMPDIDAYGYFYYDCSGCSDVDDLVNAYVVYDDFEDGMDNFTQRTTDGGTCSASSGRMLCNPAADWSGAFAYTNANLTVFTGATNYFYKVKYRLWQNISTAGSPPQGHNAVYYRKPYPDLGYSNGSTHYYYPLSSSLKYDSRVDSSSGGDEQSLSAVWDNGTGTTAELNDWGNENSEYYDGEVSYDKSTYNMSWTIDHNGSEHFVTTTVPSSINGDIHDGGYFKIEVGCWGYNALSAEYDYVSIEKYLSNEITYSTGTEEDYEYVVITINQPQNVTFTNTFNVSFTYDTNSSSQTVNWSAYELDSDGTNVSMGSVNKYQTELSLDVGDHNLTIWANDSDGNLETSFFEFYYSDVNFSLNNNYDDENYEEGVQIVAKIENATDNEYICISVGEEENVYCDYGNFTYTLDSDSKIEEISIDNGTSTNTYGVFNQSQNASYNLHSYDYIEDFDIYFNGSGNDTCIDFNADGTSDTCLPGEIDGDTVTVTEFGDGSTKKSFNFTTSGTEVFYVNISNIADIQTFNFTLESQDESERVTFCTSNQTSGACDSSSTTVQTTCGSDYITGYGYTCGNYSDFIYIDDTDNKGSQKIVPDAPIITKIQMLLKGGNSAPYSTHNLTDYVYLGKNYYDDTLFNVSRFFEDISDYEWVDVYNSTYGDEIIINTDFVYYLSLVFGHSLWYDTYGSTSKYVYMTYWDPYLTDYMNYTEYASVMDADGSTFHETGSVIIVKVFGYDVPYNVSIDVGGDNFYDYEGSGKFNETYTLDLNETAAENYCSSVTDTICQVPVYITNVGTGVINVTISDVSYKFNPIEPNVSAVNDMISAESYRRHDYNMTMTSDGSSDYLNITNISIDYEGSDNITLTATVNSTGEITRTAYVYNSNFTTELPYSWIDSILLYAVNPDAQYNATPYGQTDYTPILNISMRNYDKNASINLTVSDFPDCVTIYSSNDSSRNNATNIAIDVYEDHISVDSSGLSGTFGSTVYYAQSFKMNKNATIEEIDLEMKRSGVPYDDIYVGVYGNNGTSVSSVYPYPNMSDLKSNGTISAFSSATKTWYTAVMEEFTLEEDEYYVVVVNSTGSDASGYTIYGATGDPYSSGILTRESGGSGFDILDTTYDLNIRLNVSSIIEHDVLTDLEVNATEGIWLWYDLVSCSNRFYEVEYDIESCCTGCVCE